MHAGDRATPRRPALAQDVESNICSTGIVDAITSRRHPLVARFRRLAQGRTRTDPALLLDGWHLVADALRANLTLEVIAAVASDDPIDPQARDIVAAARAHGARVVPVSRSVLDAISPVRSPAGVVAIARAPDADLAATTRPHPALALVAVGVQDPGNLGAIVRVADAAGATGVIVTGASADPFGWKALRGAMGSAFRLPVVRVLDPEGAIASLHRLGVRVVATASADARSPHVRSLYEHDLRGATAVLLGNEGAGLPDAVAALADATVSIPMRAGVDSLNLATAAAIIAYEVRRQRLTAARADPRDAGGPPV
jgi:TrmH family RNA methyltransferase